MASKSNKEFAEHKKEGIWQHFLREKNGQSAKCKMCSAELKTTGGSTKGLHEHMKRLHGVNMLKQKNDDDDIVGHTSKSQPQSTTERPKAPVGSGAFGPMNKFLLDKNEQTLQAVIGRMTSCDGLPFRVFVTSPDLRRALTALGLGRFANFG